MQKQKPTKTHGAEQPEMISTTAAAGARTCTIESATKGYNSRRYSKPWIARIDYRKSVKGEYIWGTWIGEHRGDGTGTPGLLVVQASSLRDKRTTVAMVAGATMAW